MRVRQVPPTGMNPPLPIAKTSVPASIIVAGKQTKEGSSGNDNNDDGDTGAPETTQTVETISSTKVPVQKRPPAAASNTPSSRWEEAKQSQAAPAAATDGGASILPPPPRVAGAPPGSSSSSSGSYKPPKWGLAEAPEASGLSLTVLKGGIEVSSISLDNRTHVLLGELDFCPCRIFCWCAGVAFVLRSHDDMFGYTRLDTTAATACTAFDDAGWGHIEEAVTAVVVGWSRLFFAMMQSI